MDSNSGIYKIVNIANDRVYIGSAKDFKKRWNEHLRTLRANKHRNAFLQNDFNKCGEESFQFLIVEVCDESNRLIVEQNYLNKYFDNKVNCYNIKSSVTEQGKVFSHTPEETKAKKSVAFKGKKRPPHVLEALRQSSIGRKISDKTRKKLSDVKKGRKLSKEHREIAIKNLKSYKRKDKTTI